MPLSADAVAGLLLLALAAAYMVATRQIPESSLSDAVGATGLPYVLAAALVILAVALVVKGVMAAKRPASEASGVTGADDEPAAPARALGFALIGVGYMIVAPLTGYVVGVALLVVAVALYERERLSIRLVAVAAAGGVGFWLVFVKLLGTIQPVSRFWS